MKTASRIESIDALRGLVMVFMVLDHVRSFVHQGALLYDPTNMETTTPALFFTRFITHFCAPIFIFLAGVSIYLYQQNQPAKTKVISFLISRGIWLIFIELAVISFLWTLNPAFNFFSFQVIWVIGICFVLMAALVFIPFPFLLAFSLLLIFGHNQLDTINFTGQSANEILWYFLHQKQFVFLPSGIGFAVVYPLVPWLGVMSLGYCLGGLFNREYPSELRQKNLLKIGLITLAMFITLRLLNGYGDPVPWQSQESLAMTTASFFNVSKYPPSLMFLLITLGGGLLFLSWSEHKTNRVLKWFVVFGNVPFFFYIAHLFAARMAGQVIAYLQGRTWNDMVWSQQFFSSDVPATHGLNLLATYGVWIAIVILLYYPCKKFSEYKKAHKAKWWPKYL